MGLRKERIPEFNTKPQLLRLHGLVQRIQKGDYPTRETLAAEWEKSARTIQSDLDFIRDSWRMPLEYHPQRYGYFFSEPVRKFPMIQMSEGELVSVFVAQKALSQFRGTPFEQPLKSAFQKLVSGLQGEISVAWADLDAAISFRGIETDTGDVEVLQKLSVAIRGRNEIEFIYQKVWNEAGQGTGTTSAGESRRVRPYHLASIGNQWYLFGYDLLRRDVRKFVPVRMSNLRLLQMRFSKPKDFSVDNLLKGSFGVFSGGKPIEMKIWFDRSRAQLIRERRWHQSQKIRELKNGDLELSLQLSGFIEIVPWILSWGEHARALAPKELVNLVSSTARKIAKAYSARTRH